MKDLKGIELAEGDLVAFPRPNYRGLCTGTITSFTQQKVRIEYTNTWNYGNPGRSESFLTSPQDVVKL